MPPTAAAIAFWCGAGIADPRAGVEQALLAIPQVRAAAVALTWGPPVDASRMR